MNDIDMNEKPFTGIKEFTDDIAGNSKPIYNLVIEKNYDIGFINKITVIEVTLANLTVASGQIKGGQVVVKIKYTEGIFEYLHNSTTSNRL